MSTELSIEVLPDALTEIVKSVFETMLGLEIEAGQTEWLPGREHLTASVHLSGEWNGALQFECDRDLACRFAGRLLVMDPPETVDDEVRDVLGELANMIGGNLKRVLAPGLRLSIPSVVDGGDYCVKLCHARVRARIAYQCEEGCFRATVLHAETESGN